jgi:hypothetical protein
MSKSKIITEGKVDAIQEAVAGLMFHGRKFKAKPRAEWSDKEVEWYNDGKQAINDYLRAKGRI